MLRKLLTPNHDSFAPSPAVTIEPIGVVHNRIKKPMMHGWESVQSKIHLRPELAPALAGLEGHSHLIVLFWMHAVPEFARRRIQHHLHGDEKLPVKGDLATRSQNRPNPVGVSVVALRKIEGESLTISGLDAIDGTPVLDIKPYIPEYDSYPEATVPGWVYGRLDG